MKMNNSHNTSIRVILFASILFLSVVSDGTYGDQKLQFTPLQCNNTAICAFSQPSTFLYSVMSVTSCATECYFKQYKSAPCVGFNYRATNNSCDIFIKEPRFFDKEVGCQYYQRPWNTKWKCATLPVIQMGNLVTSWSGTTQVIATAILNRQLFVTRYHVGQVSVYDTTSFQLARQIVFSALGNVLFGLTTSAINNYLHISDYIKKLVHRVDLSVTNTVSVVTWSVPDGPVGISMTSVGNILVASYIQHRIMEYTSNGSLIRVITNNNYLWHAVEVNKDIWAFTVIGPMNGICTTITDGTLIKCFTGSEVGSGITQMSSPRHLVVDSRGYILVADRNNNRILTVDPSLSEARQLSLPPNTAQTIPIALSYDESRGRLYVGEDNGSQQRVLVFDGVW